MRLHLAALLSLTLATTAHGWQAGHDGAICTLTHSEDGVEVRLTHDPGPPLWTIAVRGPEPWPEAPSFAIAFLGGAELTISTDRHTLSADGRTINVADRGFGNVLAGLSGNAHAVFRAGGAELSVSLEGAAPEVAAFEACGSMPSV
ncbi:hypothetical protein [Roseicyclus mahoneyensis]|jgi:hypothetical protein|uniref:Uncharacterized protein n=1 Tax=Roseicyclus mahoneyensis TaxID=164332 RepID=A0A316GAR3_9RHOB|nr:hypothetical protein [Roseicyclus mahoneyensis]PWK57994.1 hypothetical protein C7455_11144 [Roseicyclus mahoneyensis]